MKFLNEKISGVIFDMDGLLLDTERISMRAWQAAAREQKLEVPDEIFLKMVGHREADCVAILKNEYGAAIDGAAVALSTGRHYHALLEKGIPVMRGAENLLRFLTAQSVPLAVATSTHAAIAIEKLRRVDLLKFFKNVTGGDQVKNGKPAPDIYLAAAASLNLNGTDCVAFEDSSPGAQAAFSAGLRVALVPDLTPPTPEARKIATRILASLEEAVPLFEI